jgi:transcription initiation factor TFIIB
MTQDIDSLWETFDRLTLSWKEPPPPNCDCGSDATRTEGYQVCVDCGRVLDLNIHEGPEWRTFSDGDRGRKPSVNRCGPPAHPILADSALSTCIAASPNVSSASNRLRKVHQWNVMGPKDRHMLQMMRELEHLDAEGQLGSRVVAISVTLYEEVYRTLQAYTGTTKRCNNRVGLKAACVYFACRSVQCPRDRKEIATMLGAPVRIITKGINTFMDIMGGDFVQLPPLRAHDFVNRFSNALNLKYPYQSRITCVLDYCAEISTIRECTPISLVSGAILYVVKHYGLDVEKERIRIVTGSSVMVINRTLSALLQHKDALTGALRDAGLLEKPEEGSGGLVVAKAHANDLNGGL